MEEKRMDSEMEDIEAILERQEKAMNLLERLRMEEPIRIGGADLGGGGRRDFRRWPTPDSVQTEWHDGTRWQPVSCLDIGIAGGRFREWPQEAETPVPMRLRRDNTTVALILADMMWRDMQEGLAGMRFEFVDNEARDHWAVNLIDALLAQYALA